MDPPQAPGQCLYGDGPVGHPFLFRRDDGARFLIGDDDVLRNSEGIAIIGDPRNDSHMLISQLHLAMQRVHNAFVMRARRAGVPDAELFEQELTGDCKVDEYQSLAIRDLERGEGVGLPSGEALARHLGETPLTREEIGVESTDWRGETPLWFYIPRESYARAKGDHLGPVGARIAGDVLIGLIESDPRSYQNVDPTWRPAYPTLARLLEFGATAW